MFLVIEAKHFVAGVEVGKRAAPIIQYMKDWSEGKIRQYCFWKGWEVKEVSEENKNASYLDTNSGIARKW
jgi:hypothetical protein